jgi:phosphatidylglycerophosphate synthase
MEGMRPTPSAAEATQRQPSPLTRLNAILARPLASFFLLLGIAPGQLSLQSFTVTAIGLVRMADGAWVHLATGAAIVYLGLLLDRADAIVAQRKGRPPAWGVFLGTAVDRMVEVALAATLGLLAVRGVTGLPLPVPDLLGHSWTLVLACGLAGLMMAVRALGAHSEVMLLRIHLLSTRRLPGPSAIPRSRPAQAVVERLAGRDETIALWCLGVALGQLELTILLLLALQAALLVERLVLFRLRLRDPEPEASRVLGPDYP